MSISFFLFFILLLSRPFAPLPRLFLCLNATNISYRSVFCLKPNSHRSGPFWSWNNDEVRDDKLRILLWACSCLITYRTKFCSSSIIFVSHILRGDFPRVWSLILFCEDSCCRFELMKHRLRSSRCNNVYLFLLPWLPYEIGYKICRRESESAVKTQNTKDCEGSFLLTLSFYPTLSVHFMYFVCSAKNPLQVKSIVCPRWCCRVFFQSRCESLYCISYLISQWTAETRIVSTYKWIGSIFLHRYCKIPNSLLVWDIK